MEKKKTVTKFPDGFPVDRLPEGAREQEIEVYRICPTGAIEAESFLPSYLDDVARTKENYEMEEKDIGFYGMSTFEKKKDAERLLKCIAKYHPRPILSKGYTAPICGPCQRTSERLAERKKKAGSHVDWWLYESAKPHMFFHAVEEKKEDNPT